MWAQQSISVVYPQSPWNPPACRLWLKAPALNLCENTLLLHVQCVWVPLSLISAIEQVCKRGKPSKPLSVPGNCNRSKLSQHVHGPHPPSTAQLGWKQGFVLLAFSEHCHHCSNQSSHNELRIPQPGPTLLHQGEQTPAKPVHQLLAARMVHADKQHNHPLHWRPRGWWQANGKILQGINIRASFPLLAAHYGSDLWGSGLLSVAGGTSGFHINYLMNVTLFSVHESFMTWVQFWQKCEFSVSSESFEECWAHKCAQAAH